ncbi:MAG: LytTR family DNA-binding domain-containing protein [Bacteroidales bacterium]|nr:LytTR family DNA-binding domain-containing protein [Bacteroidales bacterium]
MIRSIIIEDELKSRDVLKSLLERYCSYVEVLAEAEGVADGIGKIKKHKPDVIFLDIQMPDGSGFRLLEKLDKIDFDVIFTTAFDQYAIRAFKYSALDYLLKPISPDDLINAVEKVRKRKLDKQINQNIEVLLGNINKPEKEPPKIILSTSDKIHVVDVNNIIRCESDNYYTRFFFREGAPILISKTLKENEELLSDHNFIRPHKSHLININYIKAFLRIDNGYIQMTDGSKIPVSRRKREKIMEIINHLQI